MKLVLIILLLAVIASLASGLWFLAKDSQGGTRLLKALKIRVALSVLLISFLILGYYQGWISPNMG